jgi:hypothetical protein
MRFIEERLFPKRRFVKSGAIDEILAVLGKWGVIVFVIGIIVAVFFLNIKPKLDANGYISDLQTILQGLNTYYSGYHKYPKGSGWGWNTNNAYVSPDIVNKGWQYSCQDSTIKIKKVRVYLPRTVSKQTAFNTNAELYLDKVVEMLNTDEGLKISLIGYTDSTGGNARNKAIGLRRAKILKSILVNKGAPAARIIADSKGEEDPIWSNKSKAGREKNRRVELTQFIEVENKEQE